VFGVNHYTNGDLKRTGGCGGAGVGTSDASCCVGPSATCNTEVEGDTVDFPFGGDGAHCLSTGEAVAVDGDGSGGVGKVRVACRSDSRCGC